MLCVYGYVWFVGCLFSVEVDGISGCVQMVLLVYSAEMGECIWLLGWLVMHNMYGNL